VYVRVALPGQVVEFPVAPASPTAAVRYHWVRAADGSDAVGERPLTGSVVVAPGRPGSTTSPCRAAPPARAPPAGCSTT
jgi:hypothetical protein